MERIPVSGPWITQKEIDYVNDAVTHAWYSEANRYHQRFERAFAEYVGRKFAMCLPSCTSAIHLSLLALGIGPGDEVIVPEATWIATAAPISYVGATPIFADIDPISWCLSPGSLEKNLSPRTKAVIPVGLYGGMPDFKAIETICAQRGIAIIEDAAEAMGSMQAGRKAGAFGALSVFSFHGSKTMTTGEGGMLVTDDGPLFERVQFLRDHGRKPTDKSFYCSEVGFKYKMSSLQAALGLAQLERIDELVKRKREIFSWYYDALRGMPGLQLNAQPSGTLNSYWMSTVVIDESYGLQKEELIDRMRARGVETRPFFYPLSSMPAFYMAPAARQASARNEVAYDISGRAVNLPSGFNITPELVRRVVDALKASLSEGQHMMPRRAKQA